MLRSKTMPGSEHSVWPGGALFLLTALAALPAAAQSTDGERLFRQRCAACHALEVGGRGSAPSLAGVFGREAGTLDGARYSQAMQEAGLTWDAETLDAFIENPQAIVPGTTMSVRISDPGQRAAIVAFLQQNSAGG
ncbi:MAG: c-type cytochrome [Roseovarius sp.]